MRHPDAFEASPLITGHKEVMLCVFPQKRFEKLASPGSIQLASAEDLVLCLTKLQSRDAPHSRSSRIVCCDPLLGKSHCLTSTTHLVYLLAEILWNFQCVKRVDAKVSFQTGTGRPRVEG